MDTLEAHRALVRTRVHAMRTALHRHGLAMWIVPSADPHLSEYLPDRWRTREWLSGFTGSVGTLVVTRDGAGLWVDSRYWFQAEAQIAGTGIELHKSLAAVGPAPTDWIAANVRPGDVVGIDGASIGLSAARKLRTALEARGAELRTTIDLLDEVWSERPSAPSHPVVEHTARYAPRARADKLAALRRAMRDHGATHHFVSTLDDIAWLFNLRGSDVEYNPVFVAHALVALDGATLFVEASKIKPALRAALAHDGVELAPYAAAETALARLNEPSTLLIDPNRITLAFREAVAAQVRVIEAINPTTLAKSRKTDAEAAHIRHAMEQDGAALCEFFAWFEAAIARDERITELDVDTHITAARARRPGFVSPSFATIAGWMANGAMPHYRATEASHAVIDGAGLLLIDSGGQYEYGTTDITRVVQVRATTPEQRRDFTRVLKGMIALSVAVFPRGVRSPMLDTIARAPLWAAQADYGHGTGHGVGYFLNVHEGPHGITPHLPPEPQTAMEPGMVTSNEPGLYRPGHWGVRIENLVLNVPAGHSEFGEFLAFETLTLCPIDTRCIDLTLMRTDEIAWLDAYHATVRQRLMPLVDGAARQWLVERTRPLAS